MARVNHCRQISLRNTKVRTRLIYSSNNKYQKLLLLGWSLCATPLLYGVVNQGITPTPLNQSPPQLAVINFESEVKKGSASDNPIKDQTTVSVMPLLSHSGESAAWLSKGLADMLIRDLSEVRSLIILEREKMQKFSRN